MEVTEWIDVLEDDEEPFATDAVDDLVCRLAPELCHLEELSAGDEE
jgi:hypothetical protein